MAADIGVPPAPLTGNADHSGPAVFTQALGALRPQTLSGRFPRCERVAGRSMPVT